MDSKEIYAVIYRMLPAINIAPPSFVRVVSATEFRGFIQRAKRKNIPRLLALSHPTTLLVFLGTRDGSQPDAAVGRCVQEALCSLTQSTVAECERLLIVWCSQTSEEALAVVAVLQKSGSYRIVAKSWQRPDQWEVPLPDTSQSATDSFESALARVETVIDRRREPERDSFATRLDRATALINVLFRLHGGEGPDDGNRPVEQGANEQWRCWLDRYVRSARDEWRRVRKLNISDNPARVTGPRNRQGPLAGKCVFISYARPDAASLAIPVRDALVASGATVWFDHDERPDEKLLNEGFEELIHSFDVYLMCASNEFFERGGYATQELAWALRDDEERSSRLGRIVVYRRGTILPTAIRHWGRIEYQETNPRNLNENLARLLLFDRVVQATIPVATAPHSTYLPLNRKAEPAHLKCRMRHLQLLQRLKLGAFVDYDSNDLAVVRQNEGLFSMAEHLDWSGTLVDMNHWPDDSFIRDIRLRLGSLRALHGAREPQRSHGVSVDIEQIATRPVPISQWPVTTGWHELERLFALRFYAGILRTLADMLARGLVISAHCSETLEQLWSIETRRRRRECTDLMLDLRRQGLVDWRVALPTWDDLYRTWQKLLQNSHRWDKPATTDIGFKIASHIPILAATLAEVTWHATRTQNTASQTIDLFNGPDRVSVALYVAFSNHGMETEACALPQAEVALGIIDLANSVPKVSLSWNITTGNNSQTAGASTAWPEDVVILRTG